MNTRRMTKNISDIIKSLDGVAVANIDEPSEGDLARVLGYNLELRSKYDALLAENENLKKEINELKNEKK